VRVIVSAAPHVEIDRAMLHGAIGVVHDLRAADAALCKSGTTTLEAAVAGCPLAVAYEPAASRMPRPAGW
jgi:hypothetical protein